MARARHAGHTASNPPNTPPQSGGDDDVNTGTAECGNAHQGEGACIYGRIASSEKAHLTMCAAEHNYWGCNAKAEARHSQHTRDTSNGDGDTSGGNDDTDDTSGGNDDGGTSGNNAPSDAEGVCPADGWTECGGTFSHLGTCLAGHKFFTCNPAAVARHARH